MTKDIDRIKFELLNICERGATVDIASWVERFPEHREELLDFWLWARPRGESDESPPPGSASLADIARDALQRACLAVSLGSEWLKPLVLEAEGHQIAGQLQELRKQVPSSTPTSRRAFRRAVVYAWVIEQLAAVRVTVSRLATQKTTYLLENSLRLHLFDSHQKKPLGPYDHFARYRDAEPIAARKRWIRIVGSTLEVGEQAREVQLYARRYLRSIELALALTQLFAKLTDDQLETLATVHWVGCRLSVADQSIAPTMVLEALQKDTEWSAKLKRTNFSYEKVGAALRMLIALDLLRKP
ncbi:MAG TPA: hypothetical protein VEM13_11295 [Gemmatimonadales bacterium]|nr:hypothetical protein [Gemmatimonadales bacterium]